MLDLFDHSILRRQTVKFVCPKEEEYMGAILFFNRYFREKLGQCLKRRFDSSEKVSSEFQKWTKVRNDSPTHIGWQFRTSDAIIKLKSLYPEINIQTE